MRRAKPELPSFPPDKIEALNAAWARYQSVRRSVYVGAPCVMRRYLRTQDRSAMTVAMTRYLSRASSGMRGWQAACRRVLGRNVLAEPVGTAVLGMTTGFLVRVPRKGTHAGRETAMDERLWGRILGDPVALARMAAVRGARRREAHEQEREALVARQYAKMVAALTEARERLVLKAHALDRAQVLIDRGITSVAVRDAVQELRHESYRHHGRYARCWARANKYKRLLEAMGFRYDLNSI